MKFKSKEDLDVPIDEVFTMLSDFEKHERSALRRGLEVSRRDDLKAPAVGATWDVKFMFRGKRREANLEVVEYDQPSEMVVAGYMQGLETRVEFLLVALSKTRTRLSVVADLKPQTLSARLLMQSLKLARGKVVQRFDARLATMARDMEERAGKTA